MDCYNQNTPATLSLNIFGGLSIHFIYLQLHQQMHSRISALRFVFITSVSVFLFFNIGCKKGNNSGDKDATPAATCSDGIQNQGETGIDCGGPCSACVKTKRDSVIEDYNTNYIGSNNFSSGWTGNVSTCDAGTIPQSSLDKTLQRINYFRRMVGLNDNIAWDTTKFPMYQQTALMMRANNTLDHYPPSSWLCYTTDGANGAKTSNLAMGSSTSSSVTQFMIDAGASNTAVGHRRWILHSTKTVFSVGSTDYTMSLGVVGFPGGNKKIPEFIAYPPKGYVPQSLVFARWSFGLPGADFSAATVTMKDQTGKAVSLTVLPVVKNYGDNTIVWEPQGIVTNSSTDVSYTVTVSGIQSAAETSYTYTVTLVKP